MLAAVSPLDEGTLQKDLAWLVDAELLYQRGAPPQSSYIFKHALIQDAAYESLLRSTRQQYHQRAAQVLAAQFPSTAETQPELLAHHYTEAGLSEQAIDYWQRAGQRAVEGSANVEAISHLTQALSLLKALEGTSERVERELSLQIALGNSLMAAKGYGSPEVGEAYARARELCQQVGETSQLLPVLYGLWAFYLVRAEHQRACELGGQFLRLAQSSGDPALVVAHRAQGYPLLSMGELAIAREHLEQVESLYDPQQHRPLAFLYGQDSGMSGLSVLALTLQLLGYPDQAKKRCHQALALDHEPSHPPSLAYTLGHAAMLYQFRRDLDATRAQAEAAITLSIEHRLEMWAAWATVLKAWVLTHQKQGGEGMDLLHRTLTAFEATGAGIWRPYFLALQSEAYKKAGQVEAGLDILAEAQTLVEKTGERIYEAELYRLKGELLLMGGVDESEAEACYHEALEVARRQQAKSLELRAAVSLGRLWQKGGNREEAHQRLAEIYGWFTEGFDTTDLKEAKALLEELSTTDS